MYLHLFLSLFWVNLSVGLYEHQTENHSVITLLFPSYHLLVCCGSLVFIACWMQFIFFGFLFSLHY